MGETGEDGCVQDDRGDSKAQSSVATRRRPLIDPDSPMHCDTVEVTTADRTRQWVNGSGVPPQEGTPSATWIDRIDPPNVTDMGQPDRLRSKDMPCPLPKLVLEKFRGDPLHWPRWSALFKSLVHDRRELSDAERLTHLQTCLEGSARDAVSGLLCDGSFYGEALRELQQQFGDPTAVVRSSILQVLRLPSVPEHNPAQLSELSRALHSAVSVLR